MKYFSDKALDNRIKEIASTVSGYEAGDGIDISSFVISVDSEKYSDWNEAHSAVSNLGDVADEDSRLVNGDTVYDFVMSHLSSVFRPLGITTTPVYDGDSVHTSVLIGGQWHEVVSGDVVTYGSKEFFWNTALTPNQWSEFGDIYALWQQVGSAGVDAQTLELKVHNYVGVKKGIIFDVTAEEDYDDSPAHLMLRNLGTPSEPNYALYTPYALITGGDQIVGSGTPGGGGGGGTSYLSELRDVEFGLSPSVGQILVYAANVPLNPDGTQYGPGWTVANMPSGDVTSISVNGQTYSPSGGVVTLPNYPTIPSTYAWSAITGTPTTLGGYGITDAKIENGVITLGSNSITPLTSHQTIYGLTLKVGTSTVGSYTPNSSAQTLTVTAQNLYDTIGSTKYHPYGGDTESPTFKIGGATLTWHPESSVGAGDAYLEIDSALLTLGDQIVMTGTPGGGGEGAGYLYELKDTISSWTAKPSVSATQVLVFDPQAQDKESNTGAWKYVPATDIGRIYTGGTGITIDQNTNEISLTSGVATAGTYRSVTVDTYGRVTAGTNPTTLSGYGITDAVPSSRTVNSKALSSNITLTLDDVGNGSTRSLANYVLKAGDSMSGALTFSQGSSSRRNGIIGTYDANRAAAIWSMGSSYQIAADGLTMGSLYGACYAYYGSGYTYGAGKSGGHSFVWAQNGSPTVALGNNVWTSGGFIKNGSSDDYFLLGGGGHVERSTYALSSSLADYLPLTGGTISSGSIYSLYLNNSASGATYVGQRFQIGGTSYGSLVVGTDGNLYYGPNNGGVQTIYHSGNSNSTSVNWSAKRIYFGQTPPSDVTVSSAGLCLFDGPSSGWETGEYPYAYASGFSVGRGTSLQIAYQRATGGMAYLCGRVIDSGGDGAWVTIYNAHNANSTSVNWSAKTLTANYAHLGNGNSITNLELFGSASGAAVGFYNNGTRVALLYSYGDAPFRRYNGDWSVGYTMYDSGNANKGDVSWTASTFLCINGTDGGYFISDAGGTARRAMYLDSANNFGVGYGTAHVGYNTYLDGNAVYIRYGTSHTIGIALNSSGNVGIGTTTPGYKLDVNGIIATNSNIHLFESLKFTRPSYCYVSATGSGAALSFNIGDSGSANSKMLINNNGNVSIGYFGDGSSKLYVAGAITSTGDQVISSDERLKTIVKPVDMTVEQLAGMRAVIYDRKDSGVRSLGVIAQDWEKVLPESVNQGEYLTFKYAQTAMVSAIVLAKHETEQDKEIKKLREKVQRLEEDNLRLKARLGLEN